MDLIYKTLFEIKIEHEYFLTKEDGTSLFSKSAQADRLTELELADKDEKESISRDLDFRFPDQFSTIYKQLGLKVLPSYSGFRVLMKVNRKKLSDNSIVYEPFFDLAPSLDIYVLMIRKNNSPEFYSNTRISRAVPSCFMFSNENIPGQKVFPFLTKPVSLFDAGVVYSQGEIALDSANNLQELYFDNNGNLQQKTVTTAVRNFAGEDDRMLLPLKFRYSIAGNDSVTQLDISLKDSLSNVIKTFSFSSSEPLRQVDLDFTDKDVQLSPAGGPTLPNAIFSLEATGNNSYSNIQNVVFSNNLFSAVSFGVVHMRPRVANTLFNLINDQGYIKKGKDGAGNDIPAPVFEITFKSRFANFRYLNNSGRELVIDPSLNNFLYKEEKALVSQVPVSLCRYYFMVPDNTATLTKYLPNPKNLEIKKDEHGRILFDIMVPESDLFEII